MTDGTFEAFRKAEALMAQRRPLDALRELKQVLDEAGEAPSVQLLAGRAYLGSAQLNRAEEAFRKVPTSIRAITTRGSRSAGRCNGRTASPRRSPSSGWRSR
jgi:thioredoxin-like negative regulator of GroEL